MNKHERGLIATNTLKLMGHAVFRFRGWDFEPLPDYWQPRQVIIGFPHTSLLDTFMAFGGFAMVEQKGHIIIKKEAFFFPLGSFLRFLGGVAIDRSASTGLVQQLADIFASREVFQLAVVPEGTRKGAKRWKTGFWHIARAADVPIVVWYIDNANRKTRWLGQIVPSDDIEADMAKIHRMYAAAGPEIGPVPPK